MPRPRDDFTMFHLTFAKEDLEKVIELESDRFQNLSYDEAAFQTEAGAVYGEYRIGRVAALVRPAREAAGFGLRRAYLQAYDDRFRGRHQGDAQGVRVQQALLSRATIGRRTSCCWSPATSSRGDGHAADREVLRPVAARLPAAEIVPEPPQTAPRSAEVTFPGRTLPILVLAYKGDAFDTANRDYVAARLLAELAFGPESELVQEARAPAAEGGNALRRGADQPRSAARSKSRRWSKRTPTTSTRCGKRSTARWRSSRPGRWLWRSSTN